MPFKKCILCDKENNHNWFGICFICWVKIDDAVGVSPKTITKSQEKKQE